jgi:hypothetical protein
MIKNILAGKVSRGIFLVLSFLLVSNSWGAPSDTLVGALFGTAYVTAFDSKEVDFYTGQIFYNNEPAGFSYFDTYSTTFGSDITLYNQDVFNWFVGTERLGRTGNGFQGAVNLQWNIPVDALYSGARFDWPEKALFNPYFFCIGGLYSLSDLLGSDFVICNGVNSKSVTYNGSTYNVGGTALGLELGLGFTPLKFDNLELSIEGNYRFANFPNVSYSPTSASSSIPAIPSGLPTSLDYSGWSFAICLAFEPPTSNKEKNAPKKEKNDPMAAREKLFAGNVPYNKKTFLNAAENGDIYVVRLFLESGFKVDQKDLISITNNENISDEIKKLIQPLMDKQ